MFACQIFSIKRLCTSCIVIVSFFLPLSAVDNLAFVTIEDTCGTTEYGHHIGDALMRRGISVEYYHYEKIFSRQPQHFIENCCDQHVSTIYLQHYFVWWHNNRRRQKWLYDLVTYAHTYGIKVYATIHEDFKPSSAELKFLRSLDASIIHRNVYKLPPLENVYLVPHPVPVCDVSSLNKQELRIKYGFNDDDRLITTTGFLNPQKSIPEILQALFQYLRKDKKLKLQVICAAVLPLQHKRSREIEHMIARSGLADQIYFNSSFLSQQEVAERLFMSDLGFSWNSCNQNSGSGIEKQFIASRLPYVVNDCAHFDHCPGSVSIPTDISLLAEVLTKLVGQDNKLEEMRNLLSEQYAALNYDAMVEVYAKFFGISLV